MPIFEIFLAAAPEIAGATEAAAATTTAAEAAAAAEAAEAAQAAQIAQAAEASQMGSGIMNAANPELMESVANFSPPTSMYGPESEQLAGIKRANLGQTVPQIPTPPQITPDTYGRIGPLNTPTPMASGVQDIQQFSNPASTGTGFTNTMPANVPGATPPVASNPAAYQYNPATGEYASANPQSALERGWDKASAWAEKNPFQTAGLAYIGASKLGLLDQKGMDAPAPYSGPLSKYRMSPNFQGRYANPEDYRYTPRVYNMAAGGIAQIPGYAKGSTVDTSYWTDMIDQKHPELPVYHGEIARDDDPDTRYLDPLTAAMVRQSKLNSRSYVNTPANFNKPTPMGSLNFKPVAAAHGGIMGASSLGGYAAGGNPRLLRGPGDGMSDNIPATINNRQPARLADGEFVVPADVVSHLGNGSTEAGADKLHEMMTQVRKARTGNPKQGKEINPHRFMPK
jgi:hypothetical protein